MEFQRERAVGTCFEMISGREGFGSPLWGPGELRGLGTILGDHLRDLLVTRNRLWEAFFRTSLKEFSIIQYLEAFGDDGIGTAVEEALHDTLLGWV